MAPKKSKKKVVKKSVTVGQAKKRVGRPRKVSASTSSRDSCGSVEAAKMEDKMWTLDYIYMNFAFNPYPTAEELMHLAKYIRMKLPLVENFYMHLHSIYTEDNCIDGAIFKTKPNYRSFERTYQ